MELLIIVVIVIVAVYIASLKERVTQLYTANLQLTEILTNARKELEAVNDNFIHKIRENEELNRTLQCVKSENEYISSKHSELKTRLEATRSENMRMSTALTRLRENLDSSAKTIDAQRTENDMLRTSLSEAPLGFPSLLEALNLCDVKRDAHLEYWLRTKSHPAYTAAQTVRVETRKRREAEQEARKAKLQLEYYLSLSPDAQEDIEALTDQAANPRETPPKDNDEDIARRYLSREEYDKLSVTERNQLALDRFWLWNKSKRTIGRLYEQYIGWLYERDGWIVEYFGISEGFSDLGRDLICHRDMTTHIVQCKNWSKSKRIYEKHIFQLFGTTYEYTKNNPFEEVIGVFFTSTQLSGLARSFAKEFHNRAA